MCGVKKFHPHKTKESRLEGTNGDSDKSIALWQECCQNKGRNAHIGSALTIEQLATPQTYRLAFYSLCTILYSSVLWISRPILRQLQFIGNGSNIESHDLLPLSVLCNILLYAFGAGSSFVYISRFFIDAFLYVFARLDIHPNSWHDWSL